MYRAIKYYSEPDVFQAEFFEQCMGCVRLVYNKGLDLRISEYRNGNSIGYSDTNDMLTKLKHDAEFSFLKSVDSIALQQSLRHLDTAYKNFFRDKSVGFPKFKSKKKSRKSYTTINQNGTIKLTDKGIKLPKLKTPVRIVFHRKPDPSWTIKSATVSKDSIGRYYISVLFDCHKDEPVPIGVDESKSIGFDYKSDGLYMDSSGNIGSEHKFYRQSQKKLAKLQKRLSRKKGSRKGEVKSKNWLKQQNKVNKVYIHLANQRKDYLHKKSTEIANLYDIVCVEDLNMRAMSNKGFGNGKATLDNGYGIFLTMLEYKLTERGKYLIRVDKWYPSSQICHICGHKQKLELNERIYNCPCCGMSDDRDHNAAVNILNEGLRLYRQMIAAA